MKNVAQLCVDNLLESLNSLPEVRTKKWSVVGEDDLFHKSMALSFPCIGVVYEGMRAKEGVDSGGKSSTITCSIYLLYQSGTIGGTDQKPKAIALLDSIRGQIMSTTSPSGHKWRFVFESPAEDMHKAMVYYQRWSSAVIL